jgi:flagellar biosynthesis protein FlhF
VRARIAELLSASDSAGDAPVPARLAVVGPAGAGKTTTLAKLAAHLGLRSKRGVGLLSLDARRLAAAEQLRRYADILGIPFELAQTVPQVEQAVRRLAGVEHLLIDTPGVGGRDAEGLTALAALLQPLRPAEVHLVLPAYAAPAAQTRLARTFAPLGVARVVLTHLDDAVGPGVILDVADRLHWRLSYLSFGENVPRDLETAGGRKLAELLLPPADRAVGR